MKLYVRPVFVCVNTAGGGRFGVIVCDVVPWQLVLAAVPVIVKTSGVVGLLGGPGTQNTIVFPITGLLGLPAAVKVYDVFATELLIVMVSHWPGQGVASLCVAVSTGAGLTVIVTAVEAADVPAVFTPFAV